MNTTTAGRCSRDRTDELLPAMRVVGNALLRVAPDVGLFVLFCVIWAVVFAIALH